MTPGKIIGGIVAAAGTATIILWGVPSYLDVQIRKGVASEIAVWKEQQQAVADATDEPDAVVELATRMDSLEGTVSAGFVRMDQNHQFMTEKMLELLAQ